MNFQEEVRIRCPYCGERQWILADPSVDAQKYIEDCQVCCQPMELDVLCSPGSAPVVVARRQDEIG